MKKNGYLYLGMIEFVASILFMFACAFTKVTFAKACYFLATICMMISSFGFLYEHFKNKGHAQKFAKKKEN